MFGLPKLFGSNKETIETPAAAQAHSVPARWALRTAALLALFGAQAGALWIGDHWVDNPLSTRLSRRLARLSWLAIGTLTGAFLFNAIRSMIRDSETVTFKIPTERDTNGNITASKVMKVTFAGANDLEEKLSNIMAGHEGDVTVQVDSDGRAQAVILADLIAVREELGLAGVNIPDVRAVDVLKSKLQAVQGSTEQAEAMADLRTALKMDATASAADVVSAAKRQIKEMESANLVIIEMTGKPGSAGAREIRRLLEKAATGVSLPEGFSYNEANKSLTYKADDGTQVETEFSQLKRASQMAAELRKQSNHEPLQVVHVDNGYYQLHAGENQRAMLPSNVRYEQAEQIRARVLFEQNRGRLGEPSEEGFDGRVAEMALALVQSGQVPADKA